MKRPPLLLKALTHSSFANERRDSRIEDNERLEFLGDAVLQISVSDYLYRRFSDLPEGDLTRIRAVVVCEASLAEKAREVNLGEHMYLGRGEEASGGRTRRSLLADAFEAVVGAVYLDRGLTASKDLVLRLLGPALEAAGTGGQPSDYKTALQEKMQREANGLSYQLLTEAGPDHAKVFTVGVCLAGRVLARGKGTSKKEAEQVAARKALEKVERKAGGRGRKKPGPTGAKPGMKPEVAGEERAKGWPPVRVDNPSEESGLPAGAIVAAATVPRG
jgi:ribonuclease-3